jgi:hypothetical protein
MKASELAARLRRDTDPTVARYISWAENRGRGEELRLVEPLIDAGLVEVDGDDFHATLPGRIAVRQMLAGAVEEIEAAT